MKRKLPSLSLGAILILVSSLVLDQARAANRISEIKFKAGADSSEIRIEGDAPLDFSSQVNSADKQIVVDIKGARLQKMASRRLDTSSFDSKVLLVSPYQVSSDPANPAARIVVQLRGSAKPQVSSDGNDVVIVVPNPGSTAGAGEDGMEGAPPAPPVESLGVSPESASASATDGDATVTGSSQTLDKLKQDKIAQFFESQNTKRFVGKPITLQLRDTELIDVLRLIGDASGFNIIVGSDVKGRTTLSLVDVPWDQALDLIMTGNKLGGERNGSVLRVVTLENLTAEKQQEIQAKMALQAAAPRVTRVFSINYANITDLVPILTQFGSSQQVGSGTGAGGATGASMTIIQPDNRTNSIIVRDTPEVLDRMRRLIELLDTQTPQVLIESKIVEATEGFTKSMGGQFLSARPGGNTNWSGAVNTRVNAFSGGNLLGTIGGTPASTDGGSRFGFSPNLTFLRGSTQIAAVIDLAESETKARVIASPRMVVMDREAADITQGTPVAIPALSTTALGGAVSSVNVVQANLSLAVRPSVTSDGSVLMQLALARDIPLPVAGGTGSGIGNRRLNTRVIVESGSTLVIGGIYTNSLTQVEQGLPWFRKIPLIGFLFGSETSVKDRNELFFFITPKILNEKESGIANGANG